MYLHRYTVDCVRAKAIKTTTASLVITNLLDDNGKAALFNQVNGHDRNKKYRNDTSTIKSEIKITSRIINFSSSSNISPFFFSYNETYEVEKSFNFELVSNFIYHPRNSRTVEFSSPISQIFLDHQRQFLFFHPL